MTQAVAIPSIKEKFCLDLTQGSPSEESQVISIVRENAKADRGGNKSVCDNNKRAA
jgi:hypothetical protein